jgi:hypothetical protein
VATSSPSRSLASFHTGAARALPQSARSIARLVWPRWDKDHKLAMATAIVAANAVVK